MNTKIFFLLIFSFSLLQAQDSTISKALKASIPKRKYPLVKSKYPTYQLLTGFLLVKEANNGDPYAQHELGIRYLIGKGFEPDTVQALEWIQKAADQNLVFAKFNLGVMQNNGIGVEWNPFKAYKNFKYAADSGLPAGQFAYGIFLTDNLVVNRSLYDAYVLIKKSAEGGFEPADKAVEQFEKMGYSFVYDTTKVVSNVNPDYKSFNESSNIINQNWELDFYEFEDDSLTEEQKTRAIKELLNQNTDDLKNLLGISEEIGDSSFADTSASGLIKYAANSGSPEAMLITGKGFENGIVVAQDLINAAYNYLRSLKLGSRKAAESMFSLTKKKEFFELLQKKVDEGNADAKYVWAGLIGMGFDYRITNEQAFELLEEAVKENHLQSIVETGLSYYNGVLVDKDREKAHEYWEKAISLGSEEAEIRIIFSKISDDVNSVSQQDINKLKNLSDKGSVLAQAALGYCYEKGIIVKQSKGKAVELYKKAAQRGNMAAYNSLKRMYDEIRPDEEIFVIYDN